MVAKHTAAMAELIIESASPLLVLEHCAHTVELVRKSACGLVMEIVKHSPEVNGVQCSFLVVICYVICSLFCGFILYISLTNMV